MDVKSILTELSGPENDQGKSSGTRIEALTPEKISKFAIAHEDHNDQRLQYLLHRNASFFENTQPVYTNPEQAFFDPVFLNTYSCISTTGSSKSAIQQKSW